MSEPTTVTAAVLVIGDEILSGRTKDRNLGYIAEYLAKIGVDVREARVVPDVEDDIVAALNALRGRYDYVITTGGIGPTHDDITADAVARAFGVTIDEDPRVIAAMLQRYASGDLTPARRRMARIPATAELIENPVSIAPGFRLGNVYVMAGVPAVMQAMLDFAVKTMKTGAAMRVETIEAGGFPRAGTVTRSARSPPAIRMCRSAPIRPTGTDASTTRSSCAAKTKGRSPARRPRSRRCSPRCRETSRRVKPRPEFARKSVDSAARLLAHGRRACYHGGGSLASRSRPVPPAQRDKAFPVSWDQFHRDARALAWRLASAGPFNAIVAITRGGLVPAAIVARELEVRVIETVSIASYHDYKTQGGLKVLKTIAPEVSNLDDGAKILIVDDLVDTGATAKLVREMLPRAHFATVYAKPLGRPLVDTFITEVSQDTWIYFPWDMGLAFQPPIANDKGG